jgi:uncharacterized protein with PIN domain
LEIISVRAIFHAVFGHTTVTPEQALDITIKSRRTQPVFRCPECEGRVRVFVRGGKMPTHFEHFERDAQCSLSHKPRAARARGGNLPVAVAALAAASSTSSAKRA